jgi:hypothetical protein
LRLFVATEMMQRPEPFAIPPLNEGLPLTGPTALAQHVQELLDILAWVRIELAGGTPATPGKLDGASPGPLITQLDKALELARQLALDVDADVRERTEIPPPPRPSA